MGKLTPPRNLPCPPLQFDTLDLFCGGDIPVNDGLVILQPTIRDVKEFGEEAYMRMVSNLCTIPSDIKAELDDMGKSYMEISDFELFYFLTRDMTPDKTGPLLGDLNLARMEMYVRQDNDDIIMVDPETGLRIDRVLYTMLITYIRMMHGLEYNPEYATNTYTARALIQEAHTKRDRLRAHPKPYQPYLGNMVITCCCTPEFKYNSHTVLDIGICELILSYMQIMKSKNALALLQGSYSGMIDVSKISKSKFSWVFEGPEGYMSMPTAPSESQA